MISSYPSVAIVILNWNGKHWLQQFLPSVINNQYPNQSIVIGDNASTDDSILFIQQHYPSIQIIQNATNLGFAGGYKEVLKQVKADYFILLNSDVEVTENWIKPVIDYLEQDELLAAAQPKIKSFHQKEYFEYAGAAGGFIDTNGYLFCKGRIFDSLEIDENQYQNNGEIFWATGACLFIKSTLYHKVGGLDEIFFAHQEEIDLCWRLRNAGFKIGYCAASTVYHVGGGMLPKSNPHKTFLNFRNSLFLLFKNLPAYKLPMFFSKRLILDNIAALVYLKNGKYQDAWAIARAYVSFIFHIRILVLKKYEMKNMNVFKIDSFKTNQSGVFNGSIIWQHFINKKNKFTELVD